MMVVLLRLALVMVWQWLDLILSLWNVCVHELDEAFTVIDIAFFYLLDSNAEYILG